MVLFQDCSILRDCRQRDISEYHLFQEFLLYLIAVIAQFFNVSYRFLDILHEAPLSGHRQPRGIFGSVLYCVVLVIILLNDSPI